MSAPGPLRLSLLYAVVFTEIGISMPFMPVWFAALGLDAGVIGGLLALPVATRILATAPLMSLLDRGLGPRRLIGLGSLIVAATYALMPPASGLGWPALAVLTVLNAAAGAPLVPSVDYLTLAAVRRDPRLAYARIRMAGSVAFLLASLAGGALLAALGGRLAVPALLTGLALLAALVAAASGRVAAAVQAEAPAGPRPRLPRRLWLCIGAAAAIQSSHAAVYGFGSIHWTGHGLSPAWVGALWALGVLAEIALFALVPRLPPAWREPVPLLALGGGAALVRALGLYGFGDRLGALVPLQCLHGLTFGATQLGAMAAVSGLAPEGARGRAQGTLSAVNAGVSVGATLASGAVYRAGGPLAFLAMAPLAACGLALAWAASRGTAAPARRDTVPQP